MTDRERVDSPTEARNPRTRGIDGLDTIGLLSVINDEDALVAARVRETLPALAPVVDAAVAALAGSGTIHYFGAGSSGRLGLLDAAELPPTFGIDRRRFLAHLAGGDAAMRAAREGVEDDREAGGADAAAVVGGDVAIGLTASGRTPYVAGALARARANGAFTALVTSNPTAAIAAQVDATVCADTGPEVIAGSTRMKSATAQKLILNAFSTAVMVRSGRTWSNLMVTLAPTNAKLRGRVVRILIEATGLAPERCEAAIEQAGGDLPTALVTLLAGVEPGPARRALREAGGVVAAAVCALAEGARAAPALRLSDDGRGDGRGPTPSSG